MGYWAYQLDHEFFVAKENLPAVLSAIQKHDKATHPETMYPGGVASHLADNLKDKTKAAFANFSWSAYFDEIGNIDGLEFSGNALHSEDALFSSIAPFVKNGSFISMIGEDSNVWKWKFIDGACVKLQGRVVFDE